MGRYRHLQLKIKKMMHERSDVVHHQQHHHHHYSTTTSLILWLIIHVVLVAVTSAVPSSLSSSSTSSSSSQQQQQQQQQQLNNLPTNHSIIAFGDSLTHGLYVGSKEISSSSRSSSSSSSRSTRMGGGNIMGYHSYVINLRKLINNRSISVLEYGRNTDDTRMMIPRLQKILHQYMPLSSSSSSSSSSSNQSLPLFVIILGG